MSEKIVKLNWFQIKLSNNTGEIQTIEYRGEENLSSFRDRFDSSTFLRYKDNVYIWDSINFRGSSMQTVSVNDSPYLISKIISESFIGQFFKTEDFLIFYSIGGFKIIDFREDLSEDDMPYVGAFRSYFVNFAPLWISDQVELGFSVSSSLQLKFNWSKKDFIANGVSLDGLKENRSGEIIADTTALYRVANIFNDSSRLKAFVDRLNDDRYSLASSKSFVQEFFIDRTPELMFPKGLEVLEIRQPSFSEITESLDLPGYSSLDKPKNYFYRNTIPRVGTENYAVRSKIKYNKPVSYDYFVTRRIKLGVIYPEQTHIKIATFMKAVQAELSEIYKIPEGNLSYETYSIPNTRLSSYQGVLQSIADLDLIIVVLEESHKQLEGNESPYFFCKAEFIKRGINSQQVQIEQVEKFLRDKENGLTNYADHTFSLNIYAKLGGIAWTIKPAGELRNELVFGVGATVDKYGAPLIGITSVFQGDGKYLFGDISAVVGIDEYESYLSNYIYKSVRKCLDGRILDSSKPIYLVFHLFKKAGKYNEIKALQDAISKFPDLDFKYTYIYIGDGHNFQMYSTKIPSFEDGTGYQNLERGTLLQINSELGFLALKKNSSRCCKIEIDYRSNVINLLYSSSQVYNFSDLSHSSFNKQSLPATIKYSKLMARMAHKLSELDGFYLSKISMPDNTPWFL